MAPNPRLTRAEWRTTARVLPRPGGVGRPRLDDERAVAELLYAEAVGRFGRTLQQLYGRQRAGFLSMRRQRWKEAGAWDEIVCAGRPAIARMRRREYGDCPHMLDFFAMSERAERFRFCPPGTMVCDHPERPVSRSIRKQAGGKHLLRLGASMAAAKD